MLHKSEYNHAVTQTLQNKSFMAPIQDHNLVREVSAHLDLHLVLLLIDFLSDKKVFSDAGYLNFPRCVARDFHIEGL